MNNTYSEREFIINLIISSEKNLSPIVISQKIKHYFDVNVGIEEIQRYIKGYDKLEVDKFTLKMSDIF